MLVELISRLKPLRSTPKWLRYLGTVAIVLVCFGLRYALSGLDERENLPLFLLFIPAVIVASFVFDRGSGFLAVILSSIIGVYFFVEPYTSLGFAHVGEIVRLVAFIGVGLLSASIIEALRHTVEKLQDAVATSRSAESRLWLADAQKELLLNDINHRIKNDLQWVASLLSQAVGRAADREAKEALENAGAQIGVLARVYDRLRLRGVSTAVDAQEFVSELCGDLRSAVAGRVAASVRCHLEPVMLEPSRAVMLGLIINELVTNALKHAYPSGRDGEVAIELRRSADEFHLSVCDNGVGMPLDVKPGRGQRIVHSLARELNGAAQWSPLPGGGTCAMVSFPVNSARTGAAHI